ncbi:recombinase family protein [Thermoanaerobacter thermohydrosulfuricus]|uniref:recombinase family protein n=1 Tax=Thermoanaerobacter thermohydrosulfuricus TaxID=1516 RepID=UPI0014289493|nr:recombinase family protein [Thermoanaerobacter thermohydrosulfuricus]
MKRVACLYRVSTTKQLDNNDIPMQKIACKNFIATHPDWELVKEYEEKGVSGYKKSAKERDVLQRIKLDAENHEFDILLVYMFDRLGRRDEETPFIIEYFTKLGIEVWSTVEGKQEFNDHVDKLINYIRFWQASGESQKISVRVDTKHRQMVEEGLFRGGNPPYGYKLVKSGLKGKKGNELHKLAIDEDEAKMVRLIFDLAYREGFGTLKIAEYLNEHKILRKNNTTWTHNSVRHLLRNPIYIGYMTYGKTTQINGSTITQDKDKWVFSKHIPELQIVPENVWKKVQELLDSRSPKNSKQNTPSPTHGVSLLAGIAFCGHCGSKLTSTYHYKIRKDSWGNKIKIIVPKYRCSGKLFFKTKCDGQTTYTQKKIDSIVLDEVFKYLDSINNFDILKEIEQIKDINLESDKKELQRLLNKQNENYKDLELLNNEILKSLRGESEFSADKLNRLIEQKEKEIKEIEKLIKEVKNNIQKKQVEFDDLENLKNILPTWRETFEKASIHQKKMMLSTIIDKVIVYRDKVDIQIKIKLHQFIKYSYNEYIINEDVKNDNEGERMPRMHEVRGSNPLISTKLKIKYFYT